MRFDLGSKIHLNTVQKLKYKKKVVKTADS